MSHGSDRAVLTAVVGNGLVTAAKFAGFLASGSSALLAEAVHSLADTANQGLLFLGVRRSRRKADEEHHFGYGQERYFWNLVSAITIFFIGCVYTVMHAIEQISTGHAPEMNLPAFAVLLFAFAVEGYSFAVALGEFNRQRKAEGMGFFEYLTETRDPSTLAVLIEDSVAMLGLLFAAIGMLATSLSGLAVFDAVAALMIGLLMGVLAMFLAATNRKYLLNHADERVNDAAVRLWRSDPRVQDVLRVNSIVLSPEESLLMGEVEIREEALFAEMSAEEIRQAIRFMQKMDAIRRDLEEEVRRIRPQARHIFIEFALPERDKPADRAG